MEWVIWIAVLFMVGAAVTTVRTNNKITRALGGNPKTEQVKAIEAPKPTHGLARTWIVSTRDTAIPAGWRWKCHCGVWGVADNAHITNGRYDLGTEAEAIKGFKTHAHQYNEVNTDFYKAKFEKEQADFAEYRRLCYCKDANDVLIPWKDK